MIGIREDGEQNQVSNSTYEVGILTFCAVSIKSSIILVAFVWANFLLLNPILLLSRFLASLMRVLLFAEDKRQEFTGRKVFPSVHPRVKSLKPYL